MLKSIVGQRGGVARKSHLSSMIEGLESRQLLSASPVLLKPVTPNKITAGNTGTEVVTIKNPTKASVTESVTITLAPSLNGHTAAGSYSSPSVTESLTIGAHGSAKVTVPFVPPNTLVSGKYHTLATVQIGADTFHAAAPGLYTLTVPPVPTTTPSLIGHYTGLIKITGSVGDHGATITKEAGFIWQTTSQTTTGLTGLFVVGIGQFTGTMTGSEFLNGTFSFALASPDINYTVSGKVLNNGGELTGAFHGTFINNLFKKINGNFKLTLQPS
jgi:hypothetical protein